MTTPHSASTVRAIEQAIREVRHASLIATRAGDYKKVAQLTVEVARLNNALGQARLVVGNPETAAISAR